MKCPDCNAPFESTHLFVTYENKYSNSNTAYISIERPESINEARRKLEEKAIDVCFGGKKSDYQAATHPDYTYDEHKLPKGYQDLFGSFDDDPSLRIDVCTKCYATGEISSNLHYLSAKIEEMSGKIDSLVKKKAKSLRKKKDAAAAKKKKQKEAEKIRLKKRLKELEKE